MHLRTAAALAALVFVAGFGVGHATDFVVTPAAYEGKAPDEAAKAMLEVALKQSGQKGSWERIGAGRVYYLGGYKAEGQKIFDAILAGKHKDSDVFRIARVYAEAGDWDAAKAMFGRFLANNPEDASALAEVGAQYLLHGDRATAERMFAQALEADDADPWVTEYMAGAYLGVKPQE